MKKEIKKALKFDKFKNLLAFTGEVLVWNIPAMAAVPLFSSNSGVANVMGGLAVMLQLCLMAIKVEAIHDGEVRRASLGPVFKCLLNYYPIKNIEKINQDIVRRHRQGLPQDANIFLDYILLEPMIDKFKNSYTYFEHKRFPKPHINFDHIQSIISEYTDIDYSKLINERLGEVRFLSHMGIANFILSKTTYEMREQDYEDAAFLFKQNEENTIKFLKNTFRHPNLIADWQKLDSIAIDNIENAYIYDTFSPILKQKDINPINPKSSLLKTDSVESLTSYSANFEPKKWREIASCYQKLKNHAEFTQMLKDNLPLLIEHDTNLNRITTHQAKLQTRQNISEILDLIITKAHQLVEDVEMAKVKELRIMKKMVAK